MGAILVASEGAAPGWRRAGQGRPPNHRQGRQKPAKGSPASPRQPHPPQPPVTLSPSWGGAPVARAAQPPFRRFRGDAQGAQWRAFAAAAATMATETANQL